MPLDLLSPAKRNTPRAEDTEGAVAKLAVCESLSTPPSYSFSSVIVCTCACGFESKCCICSRTWWRLCESEGRTVESEGRGEGEDQSREVITEQREPSNVLHDVVCDVATLSRVVVG